MRRCSVSRTRYSPASRARRASTVACAATVGWRCRGRTRRPASVRQSATRSSCPLRGRPLHDRIVLRLIAIDRVIHFVILGLLGIAVLLFASDRASLRAAYYRILAAIQGGVAGGPVQTSGHVGILRELDKLFTLQLRHPASGRGRAARLRDARGRRSGRPVARQALGRVPDVRLDVGSAPIRGL